MPGLLSRSKSMRMLMSHRRDDKQDAVQHSMPRSGVSQTDIARYQSATPISRGERGVETPNMAPRPSTSGGPGDRRALFHANTNPVASMQSQSDLPSSLPFNSPTALSSAGATDSSEGIIGIALGSPTVGSHWTGTPQASVFDMASQSTVNMSAWSPNSPLPSAARTEPAKSKLSRWKSMFRKPAPPPQQERPAFYQLTTTITATKAGRADSHHDDEEPVKPDVEPPNNRQIGRTPSPPTFRPNIRASRTFTTPRSAPEPPQTRSRAFTANSLPANPRVSVMRSATTPGTSHMTRNDSPAVPNLTTSKAMRSDPALSDGDRPILDVNIPDIKLDRYSVMFGNLLQPTASNPSASLLARRQGNTDRLKPLNKLSVKNQEQESPIDYRLQRRATSPGMPSASPRLSLFPSTRNSPVTSPHSSSVPRSKKLYRSKTVPEKSPLRKAFSRKELDNNNKARDLSVQSQNPVTSPTLDTRSSMNLKVQEPAITPTSVHSFESDTDSITIVFGNTRPGQPLHLDDREPEWEICTPPVLKRSETTPLSLARADSHISTQPTVTKISALSSHPNSAPLEASSPLQKMQKLSSPPQSARHDTPMDESAPRAMVGVARSVSVSRANSPRTLVRTPSSIRSPVAGEKLLGHGQALTPTMVEVRNRKSQRVQLVDA